MNDLAMIIETREHVAWGIIIVLLAIWLVRRYVIDGKPNRSMRVNGDMVGGDYHVGGINISGRQFQGQNISIINDRIYVDGRDVTEDQDGQPVKGIVKIQVTGDVQIVKCDRALDIHGDVGGDATSGGSMNCGNVRGNASSQGSMNADDVGGNASSGGSMNCDEIHGSVSAGGSVRHGK